MSSPASPSEVTALQAALAAEHAAVYAYGAVGGVLVGRRRAAARAAQDAHLARRDQLAGLMTSLGQTPVGAAAGYALPHPLGVAAAVRLAARVEDGVAAAWADAVAATSGGLRASAAGALTDCALRAAAWRGTSVALPGLPRGL